MSLNVIKGAFVVFYPKKVQPRTIIFQINPESIKRNILPTQSKKNFFGINDVRERISFVLSVDENMGDKFFVQSEQVVSNGVLAFLSAIELLVYPADVINKASSRYASWRLFGILNNIVDFFRKNRSNALPFVSLTFGTGRIIPVKIKSIKIIEQAFDPTLLPIRASIKIVMDVLSERESKYHPIIKEEYINYLRLKVMLASSE